MKPGNFAKDGEYSSPAFDAYREMDGDALYQLTVDIGKAIIGAALDVATGRENVADSDDDVYIAPDLITCMIALDAVVSYFRSELEQDVEHAKNGPEGAHESIIHAVMKIPTLTEEGRTRARLASEGLLAEEVNGMLDAIAKGHTPQ